MIKFTAEQALEAYKLAWRGESNAEIAERYNTTKNTVSQIKNGFTWSSVTLHKKGKAPKMSIEQKKAILLKGQEAAIAIDDKYWGLFDDLGEDVAKQFMQKIYNKRGLLRRRLTIQEVEEIYEQFKNGSN
jgi:transposase